MYITTTKIIDQIERLPEFGLSSLTMIDLNLNDNMIHHLGGDLWRCQRLRVLRLQNNRLSLNDIPEPLLAQSTHAGGKLIRSEGKYNLLI